MATAGSDGPASSAHRRTLSEEAPGLTSLLQTTPEKKPANATTPVAMLIKRMQNKAMLPQQLFVEQLEQYREMPADMWTQHFPENFRERVAASFLSEVYARGMTGEQYARVFLRERELPGCQPAREIIAGLAALDTML